MKKMLLLRLLLGLIWFNSSCNQGTTTDERMAVTEGMVKARAAKAQKWATKSGGKQEADAGGSASKTSGILKATRADYRTPVDKVLKGPKGEAVPVGERGAKFYINKNGNKTYLSSNQ